MSFDKPLGTVGYLFFFLNGLLLKEGTLLSNEFLGYFLKEVLFKHPLEVCFELSHIHKHGFEIVSKCFVVRSLIKREALAPLDVGFDAFKLRVHLFIGELLLQHHHLLFVCHAFPRHETSINHFHDGVAERLQVVSSEAVPVVQDVE